MDAVPAVNEIQEKYTVQGLQVYGIEFTKPNQKGLSDYIDKYKINIPTLYAGKAVAKQYGASAAPTFFLIDSNGLIIYSSIGFRKNELIKVIEKNIQ